MSKDIRLKDLLKEYRTRENLSILEAASVIGVKKSSLQRWENGCVPRTNDRKRLIEFFGTDTTKNIIELNTVDIIKRYLEYKHISAGVFRYKIYASGSDVFAWLSGKKYPRKINIDRIVLNLGDEIREMISCG